MTRLALVIVLLPLAASAATMTVNSTADNTIFGNGECTLREAIANVNAAADTTGGDCAPGTGTGDTIRFTIAIPARIRLVWGELQIQRDVSIMNPAPGSLHIDGARKSRVFTIAAGSASMLNLTIEHGSTDYGGGLWVASGAALDLVRCVVSRNQAQSDYGGAGGGIYNQGTLHLTDCALVGNTALGYDGGGGLYNSGGTATLTNCTVRRNRAKAMANEDDGSSGAAGGGISNVLGTLTLVDCRLFGNAVTSTGYSADVLGGGIFNDQFSTATLTNCTLTKNRASFMGFAAGSSGGGISNGGDMTLTNCTLNNNVALVGPQTFGDGSGETCGGAIDNWEAMTLTDCTLARNISLNSNVGRSLGGGICNHFSLHMNNCTLDHNLAAVQREGESGGGGIYSDDGMAMTNCTIVRNRAGSCTNRDLCSASGGGLFGEHYGLTATNCTFSGNVAQPVDPDIGTGGGNLNTYGMVMTNTIVADGGVASNCAGTVSGDHNLSSDGTCFTASGSNQLNTAPQLARLGNYGGPTRTMALCTDRGMPLSCRAASPAIDAGDDAVTGLPQSLATDARGLPRQAGAHVDIGADEAQ